MLKRLAICAASLLLCVAGGPARATDAPVTAVTRVVTSGAQASDTWLLHLPGIAGRRWCDDEMMLGFRDAGFAGSADIYDWTDKDPGLNALVGYKRNQAEAQKVADLITHHVRQQPAKKIILCGHSGGTGIAVWALEKLPADVKIDNLILLASALSPDYDLSLALDHVRGHCYSFCSENDVVVLGVGTKMLGTIDGKKTEAAGHCGFCLPSGVDALQYDKLIQKPYDKSWLQYHNVGDHMGCMMRPFAQAIIAPLLLPASLAVAVIHAKSDKVKR